MTEVAPPISERRMLALIGDLRKLPAETSWVEFKVNNTNPDEIGKLISAISNAARLADQNCGYVVWGIQDGDHAVVGTVFEPSSQLHQRQPLEFWLAQRLKPSIAFSFSTFVVEGHRLVLLTVPAAAPTPVEFERQSFVRIGSATPLLSDYPERTSTLWGKLRAYAWESDLAAQFVSSDDVLTRLDYVSYFEMTGQPLPDNRPGIFEKLEADRLVRPDVGGHWNITNLGAILFAKRLADFSTSLERKAVRFVAYDGASRADAVTNRRDDQRGYANGFKGLVDFIHGLLPNNEHIERDVRIERPLYPSIALREIIANALIHQDMTITGTGPLIELFKDRMEISNPGQPLVEPNRFLDSPPRSRNEALAALMRRMRLCEEQGTGIDKVLTAVEVHQLPPPDLRRDGNAVKVVLFAPRSFAAMTQEERVRACYQHAGLKFVSGQRMKNSTLCERFGIDQKNAAQASVVIRQTLEANLIRPADEEHPRAGYVPFWA